MRLLPVLGFLLGLVATLLDAQVFPARPATSQDLGVATDGGVAILLTNIGPTDLVITVSNPSSFAAFNFPQIDGEKFEVCAITTTALVVCPGTRGLDGTTAASHVAGTTVADTDHSSYHNRVANEVIAVENADAPINQPRVNVKQVFGCKGDGVTNDQPCFVAAFASGDSIFVPAGTYIIDLTTLGAWNIYNYNNATVEFSKGAKWLVKTPTNTVLPVIVFGYSSNTRFINLDYENYSTATPCNSTCGSMLWLYSDHDLWFDGLISVNAQSVAILMQLSQRLHFKNTSITNSGSDGMFDVGVLDLDVDGIQITNSGDDAIEIGSTPGDTVNYGAILRGVKVSRSNSRCVNITTPNVILTNFSCQYAQVGGVGVEYLSAYSSPIAPDNVVIADGIIQDVRNLGQATDSLRSEDGIYLDADEAMGTISISNVIIRRPDGRGIGMDQDSSRYNGALGSINTLNISNVVVENAGNSVAGTLDGSCYWLSAAILSAVNNSCNTARSFGYYVVNSGNVTINGGTFFNINATQGYNRAVEFNALSAAAEVSNLAFYDSRTPALSYILFEMATAGSVWFHDITMSTPGGTGHDGLIVSSSSTTPRLGIHDIWPAVDLGSIPSSVALLNGSRVYCSVCDTPSTPGATCTASGDHAGAQLQVSRGVNRCY